ncbi:MAG: hypothetical protein CVU66_02445 [Deltaproteobacteria bacterium HGW-Deltaproteobacteria-23]|nr:MAG: hypothetical protein CVU66_02445 [Deltaproteobacteria bacterium HGW-Deltaproteobacteria-23]
MKLFKQRLTQEESKDAGLALTLIVLLTVYYNHTLSLLLLPVGLLLLCMTVPGIFRPFAFLWFGLSALLGSVISRIVLTLIFFLVITPIGITRRLTGSDPLQLRGWKKGAGSVFKKSERSVTAADMENPY